MKRRECEIQYSRWLYPEKQNILYIVTLSCLLHVSLLLFIHFIKSQNLLTFQEDKAQTAIEKPIRIHLEGKSPTLKKQAQTDRKKSQKFLQRKQRRILTDKYPSHKDQFLIPDHLRTAQNITPESTTEKEKKQGIDAFLPEYNQNYIDELREKAKPPESRIHADSGDVPIEGPDLTPRNGALVQERYATKDLSLFQFSQEFHNKFGAIWNSQERWVPPSSPLRPGDIVYYKFYINGNGSLQKFENLTKLQQPEKDFSSLDKIIADIIVNVFPIQVPPKFRDSFNVLTDVVAIQVVNGNRPMQFSF